MSLFQGRLGLAGSRIPHVDRHGLLWLSKGRLFVESGVLKFSASRSEHIEEGEYIIPYQSVSIILLGPGTSVTHDVFRLAARHNTLLAAIGEGGVKLYSAPPFGTAKSALARKHAHLWADPIKRLDVARRMYAWRFGEILPHKDISVLRGIEGGRLKKAYQILTQKYSIPWNGRVYDRQNPALTDIPNQAINHAATFVEAAAELAVIATGALPPLGFIHEQSSNAFTLDIADLWRVELTLPLAFSVAQKAINDPRFVLERELRYAAAKQFRASRVIPSMIARIQELMDVDDTDCDH